MEAGLMIWTNSIGSTDRQNIIDMGDTLFASESAPPNLRNFEAANRIERQSYHLLALAEIVRTSTPEDEETILYNLDSIASSLLGAKSNLVGSSTSAWWKWLLTGVSHDFTNATDIAYQERLVPTEVELRRRYGDLADTPQILQDPRSRKRSFERISTGGVQPRRPPLGVLSVIRRPFIEANRNKLLLEGDVWEILYRRHEPLARLFVDEVLETDVLPGQKWLVAYDWVAADLPQRDGPLDWSRAYVLKDTIRTQRQLKQELVRASNMGHDVREVEEGIGFDDARSSQVRKLVHVMNSFEPKRSFLWKAVFVGLNWRAVGDMEIEEMQPKRVRFIEAHTGGIQQCVSMRVILKRTKVS